MSRQNPIKLYDNSIFHLAAIVLFLFYGYYTIFKSAAQERDLMNFFLFMGYNTTRLALWQNGA